MLKRFSTLFILVMVCLVILLPSITIPSVCMYVSESATGTIYTLKRCFTYGISVSVYQNTLSVTYTRTKCLYQAPGLNNVREYDRDVVDRC